MSNWEKAVQEKFGFGAKHLNISHNVWIWELWDKKQYPELAKNDNNLINKLDKLHKEFAESSKKNEGPILQEFINGKSHYIAHKGPNILTNTGMNEMGKRSTDETSTTNEFHGVGTGTTTETVSDVSLESEVGRKIIGTRQTINQTERYGTAFVSSDITTPPQDISEAAIFTLSVDGIMVMRITATPVELDVGKILTLQTNITHQNGMEV